MAPQVGFEPTTDRLTADSSTTELLWNHKIKKNCLAASYSNGTSVQLPSALESLTAVFGMGTGVASPPLPPDNCRLHRNVITFKDVRLLSNECPFVPF